MAMNLTCAVLDRGPADLAEMAVLLAIADSADKDTGEAWPSQKTLARRSRQTDRSVRNVLARLRAAGWLTWEKRLRANGSQASNVYTLDLAKLGETPRNGVPTPRNDVPPPPEHGSALEPSQKKETARGRAARRPMRPAAAGAQGRNAALGAVPSRVDGGKRQYQGPDGCWYKRPDCPEDAKAFEAWLIAGRSGHAAQAAGRS
jgi:hypothetical protein